MNNKPLNTDHIKTAHEAFEHYRHHLQSILRMERLPKDSEEYYQKELKTLEETQQLFKSTEVPLS